MINGRFRREIHDYNSLTEKGKKLHDWFASNCLFESNKCSPVPYDKAIEYCEQPQKVNQVDEFFRGKRDTSGQEDTCKAVSEKAFREFCKIAKDKIPSRYQYYLTTTSTTTTTTTITVTTNSTNIIPFLIGGIVGAIAVLAIGIAIFCCCRSKKSTGAGQSMTGTTIGGKKTTVKTTKTGTTTGTTKTGTTTAASTTRY